MRVVLVNNTCHCLALPPSDDEVLQISTQTKKDYNTSTTITQTPIDSGGNERVPLTNKTLKHLLLRVEVRGCPWLMRPQYVNCLNARWKSYWTMLAPCCRQQAEDLFPVPFHQRCRVGLWRRWWRSACSVGGRWWWWERGEGNGQHMGFWRQLEAVNVRSPYLDCQEEESR